MVTLLASMATKLAAAACVWLLYMHPLCCIIHLLCWLCLMLSFDSVEQCVCERETQRTMTASEEEKKKTKTFANASRWRSLQGSNYHKQNSSTCHRRRCWSFSIAALIRRYQYVSFCSCSAWMHILNPEVGWREHKCNWRAALSNVCDYPIPLPLTAHDQINRKGNRLLLSFYIVLTWWTGWILSVACEERGCFSTWGSRTEGEYGINIRSDGEVTRR